MTREELYQTIYTHDTIYLPPREGGSAALEVCLGCSWHKCTFCDFAKDRFQILPLTRIEYNLKVLGQLQPDNDRLFLLGENAFCINTMYLLSILDLVDKYMPNVKTFSMYSRIDDILRKSDSELNLLKSKGVVLIIYLSLQIIQMKFFFHIFERNRIGFNFHTVFYHLNTFINDG